MKFLQRKAYESERGAIQEVVHALNTMAPHVRHGPVTVPCHITPEWHQGVVIATPHGNSAIYHCQLRWWAVPLTGEQMAAFGGWQQFRSDEGEVSLAQLHVGFFRDDLGSIHGGATELARFVGESQARLTMPVALNNNADDSNGTDDFDTLFDDVQDASDGFEDIALWANSQIQSPQDWLFKTSLVAARNLDPGDVPVVTIVPDGTLLSFVGKWESAWVLVTLEHGEDPSDTTWSLLLKEGSGEKITTDSRWPLTLGGANTVEVAAATARALSQQVDQHAGRQRRALREAQLTWATVCHETDTALEILGEAISQVPRDADAETFALALPRNVVGVIRYLNDSAVAEDAQRARLETAIADINGRVADLDTRP